MKTLENIKLWSTATLLCLASIVQLNAQSSNTLAKSETNEIYFTLRESPEQNARIVSYDVKKLKYFKSKNGVSPRGENKPAISSDVKWIGFNTYQFGGWKAAVSNIDGNNTRLVSKSGNYSGYPSFSKDGKWIVYYEHESGRTGNRDIYKIKTDGSGRTQLTRNAKHHYSPSFSPDGSKITLVSARDGGNYEVFVMNSDGSNLMNITKDANHDSSPSWSPDGKRIAFLSIREGYLNLYTVNPDGTGLKNLTNNQKTDTNWFTQTVDSVDELTYMYGTSWSPDGKSIAFVQKDGDLQKVFVINADGSNLRKLVDTPGNQFNPFWAR
jgi:Tol biopolymer transport system component